MSMASWVALMRCSPPARLGFVGRAAPRGALGGGVKAGASSRIARRRRASGTTAVGAARRADGSSVDEIANAGISTRLNNAFGRPHPRTSVM